MPRIPHLKPMPRKFRREPVTAIKLNEKYFRRCDFF